MRALYGRLDALVERLRLKPHKDRHGCERNQHEHLTQRKICERAVFLMDDGSKEVALHHAEHVDRTQNDAACRKDDQKRRAEFRTELRAAEDGVSKAQDTRLRTA